MISASNFDRHFEKCNGKKSLFEFTGLCKYCGKQCKNANSQAAHENRCKNNPRRRIPSGWVSKAKGKTAEERYGENKAKELKEKAKERQLGVSHPWTDEMKRKQSELKKHLYQLHPEKHPNRRLANNKSRMSYPEALVYEELTKLKIDFEHQKAVLGFFVDFHLIDKKIFLEVDGAYWHDPEKDRVRDNLLQKEYPDIKIVRIQAKNVLKNFYEAGVV